MRTTLTDMEKMAGYLESAKSYALRAESIASAHSARLAKKMFKVCSELESAQALVAKITAAAERTSP